MILLHNWYKGLRSEPKNLTGIYIVCYVLLKSNQILFIYPQFTTNVISWHLACRVARDHTVSELINSPMSKHLANVVRKNCPLEGRDVRAGFGSRWINKINHNRPLHSVLLSFLPLHFLLWSLKLVLVFLPLCWPFKGEGDCECVTNASVHLRRNRTYRT